jgi:Relaxase/Mobilisation nuclease domain
MILKAKERGDAAQLARYLLATRENDHVELHEVSGFASGDLIEAFREADAIAKGTRCKNYLFSMSLNPPAGAYVETEVFERVADQIAEKLGLSHQPRAIVFHEKDGRRHAHVVWSRIDVEQMRSINLPHYKSKLRDVSRDIFLDQGWEMPRGLMHSRLRDPLSFTREEWQQAKRASLDPREIKSALRQCWQVSDSRASLEQALKERGFWLARGDRRGFVAIDYLGEVYSLSRYAGVTTKDLERRLGAPEQLPSLEVAKAEVAKAISHKLHLFAEDAEQHAKRRLAMVEFRRAEMVSRHRDERAKLAKAHEKRWLAESRLRAQQLPRGLSGIWQRMTGQYAKIKAHNEMETLLAWQRDRAEKDNLVFEQLKERHALQAEIKKQRAVVHRELMLLREDIANPMGPEGPDRERSQENKDRERKRPRPSRRFDIV